MDGSDVRNLIASVATIQGIVGFDESWSARAEVRNREGDGALTRLQAFDMSQPSLPTREPMELKVCQGFGFGRASSEPLDG